LPVFVCYDEDSILQATIPNVLTGGDGTIYSYQWSISPDSIGGYNDLTGETNSLYTTEAIQSNRYYKRKVRSGDCENTSLPVKIVPLALPELTTLSAILNERCYNEKDSLINVEVQKGSLQYLVRFENGKGIIDARSFGIGIRTIRPSITNPALSPGYLDYDFKVVSILDSKGCQAKAANISAFSAPMRVFTTPMPIPIFTKMCIKSMDATPYP
jgi:hypothetical protein